VKQVAQNYKSGEMALIEVPAPACRAGGVLVRSSFSLISIGTELMKVNEAGMSMLGKARSRPDQVAQVMQSVTTVGPAATYRKVMNKLDSWTPLGYSLCGTVIEVGAGITEVKVGDLVACAGNEHALHAEVNWVPGNLFVPVGPGIPAEHAAFATVGAIAIQGVRRAEPALGETALVVGLGLIGQLVCQLLAAAGVRVLGCDLDAERCLLAEALGALGSAAPGDGLDNLVARSTAGRGVDHVLLTAGAKDAAPVELAVRHARDRGRVVDIGRCTMNFPWNASYIKELDVRFSRSYGPGRYDPAYELEGRDYPAGYVRWTERRNMECFLDLLARKQLSIAPLVSHVADLDDAVATYRKLQDGELKAVAVLFRYPAGPGLPAAPAREPVAQQPVSSVPAPRPLRDARSLPRPLRIGFIGAGHYASSMLLPHLMGRQDIVLSTVVTNSALSAENARRKFDFDVAATSVHQVWDDPNVPVVFIVTRHSSHADLVACALRAGKAVFVEKPLALTQQQLDLIVRAVDESGNDRLHVGFNRRFAPLLTKARRQFGRRVGPATVRYLVNAGRLDSGSRNGWSDTEGSRFDGEGGHFLDTISWLLDATPITVFACSTPDARDLQASVWFDDGSTAVLTYATSGSRRFPKETLDLLADGKVLRLDDFRRASVYAHGRWLSSRLPRPPDKGQRAQLDAFLRAVATGGEMPIQLQSLLATTQATLAVGRSLAAAAAVSITAVTTGDLG